MSDSAFPGIECFDGQRPVTYQPLPDGGHQAIVHNPGMTLLDYFAGQALAGMLADPGVNGPCDKTAKAAFDYARAMLDEKAKRESTTNV